MRKQMRLAIGKDAAIYLGYEDGIEDAKKRIKEAMK